MLTYETERTISPSNLGCICATKFIILVHFGGNSRAAALYSFRLELISLYLLPVPNTCVRRRSAERRKCEQDEEKAWKWWGLNAVLGAAAKCLLWSPQSGKTVSLLWFFLKTFFFNLNLTQEMDGWMDKKDVRFYNSFIAILSITLW